MSMAADDREHQFANPLDLVEQIAAAHDWMFDRSSDYDLSMEATGNWCDYRMFATWNGEVRALLFACAFDLRVPGQNRAAIAELLCRINEKMLVGHFDLWSEDGMPVFRYAALMRGIPGASVEQLEDLLDIALTECERFFPAFQLVIWGGKSADEAIASAILETVGEA